MMGNGQVLDNFLSLTAKQNIILGHTKLISCFLDRWEAQIGLVGRQIKRHEYH